MFARTIVSLLAPKGTLIPSAYGNTLTAAILNKINSADPDLARMLHDGEKAYRVGNKIFKPLIHSKLLGLEWHKDKESFTIPGEICSFYVGWRKDVVDAFLKGVITNPLFRIADTDFTAVVCEKIPAAPCGERFRVSGPVVATRSQKHSKYLTYEQDNDEFKASIQKNLLDKYLAVHGKPYEGKLKIEYPHRRGMKTVSAPWGEIPVLGSYGHVKIDAGDEMLNLAFNTGAGKMNALGYGMLFAV